MQMNFSKNTDYMEAPEATLLQFKFQSNCVYLNSD